MNLLTLASPMGGGGDLLSHHCFNLYFFSVGKAGTFSEACGYLHFLFMNCWLTSLECFFCGALVLVTSMKRHCSIRFGETLCVRALFILGSPQYVVGKKYILNQPDLVTLLT